MKSFSPQTEEDLSDIVTNATAPFYITGGGTRLIGNVKAEQSLSVQALSGIKLYEPGALTMVAQAGTPLDLIEKTLTGEGQRLAFEPMDHRGLLGTVGQSTIGGVFAGNISGPRRIQVGAARDFLLGVRFVNGQGQVISNGGRVMKNVTGYDLVKLMAGSFGTLGVLTEVSFKVLPMPQMTAMLMSDGLSDEKAVMALCEALGSPFEVAGAGHFQRGPGSASLTMIRLEGSAFSVSYRAGELQKRLQDYAAFTLESDPARVSALWKCLRDVEPFHNRSGDVWRLSVKPTDAPALVARFPKAEAIYDWSGGLIWLLTPENTPASDIRDMVGRTGGHATRVRGSGPEAVFQPLSPAVEALQAGLRRRFDPRGLFNPDLMGCAA